ncbi:oxidoreductase [Rhizobium sp. Root274]|uniref:DUF934 domain-containing protein n=1 Tax=unclassified Rhizobium TaxID=2613769 RepID=UPI0007133D52|nr:MULTISPECIES: DUF934 domain-containing protein [unclassified Rhizobium]KQW27648.1 oxidoreductase [Rhizobium sp. Root1240]KRD27884.1 oxidoreductase [Rhizobium sp. Root274]
MTKIWKETGFVEGDNWVIETDEVKAAEGQRPVLGLDAFLSAVAETNDIGLGVLIAPADDVRKLEPHLARIDLIAVAFPAFNDGRGFSHATLLRERLGYKGEIRAVGDVLIDQVPLMLRTGFDSFSVSNAVAQRRLAENCLTGVAQRYQPTARDAGTTGGFSWRRIGSTGA